MVNYRAIVFDLDGCIYRGSEPVAGSADSLTYFRRRGKKILFMTNNSTESPRHYVSKLREMGIHCTLDEILTSGTATAQYLLDNYGRSDVLVVGGKALRDELARKGHRVVKNDQPDFVVAGLDTDFNYAKMSSAAKAIHNGAKFVATNTDATIPVESGFLPGAGSIVASISAATGVEPVVIGKPHRPILEIALSHLREPPRKIVFVGDRLETDVAAGLTIGAFTVLVLSGAARLRDLKKRHDLKPDMIVSDVSQLPSRLDRP